MILLLRKSGSFSLRIYERDIHKKQLSLQVCFEVSLISLSLVLLYFSLSYSQVFGKIKGSRLGNIILYVLHDKSSLISG